MTHKWSLAVVVGRDFFFSPDGDSDVSAQTRKLHNLTIKPTPAPSGRRRENASPPTVPLTTTDVTQPLGV